MYKVTFYLKTFFEFFRFKILKGIIYTEREGHGVGVGVPPRFLDATTATRACGRLHARAGADTYVYACTCTRTSAYRHTRSLNAHRSQNFLNSFEKRY